MVTSTTSIFNQEALAKRLAEIHAEQALKATQEEFGITNLDEHEDAEDFYMMKLIEIEEDTERKSNESKHKWKDECMDYLKEHHTTPDVGRSGWNFSRYSTPSI